MSISKTMKSFKEALANGNDSAALLICREAGFANQLEVDEGKFITGLDLAMSYGNVQICDALLCMGSRLDVPVGVPPGHHNTGETSLTRCLSAEYAESMPNFREMQALLGRYHLARLNSRPAQSSLTEFSKLTKQLFTSIESDIESGRNGTLTAPRESRVGIGRRHSTLASKHNQASEMLRINADALICIRDHERQIESRAAAAKLSR